MKITVLTAFFLVAPTIASCGSSFKGTVTDSWDASISDAIMLIADNAIGSGPKVIWSRLSSSAADSPTRSPAITTLESSTTPMQTYRAACGRR